MKNKCRDIDFNTGFNGQHNTSVKRSKLVKPLGEDAKRQLETRRRIEDILDEQRFAEEFGAL